ncbi:MAG: 3-hydroxyacyl-CoA dehydrogenase [Opitutae bacterium]|nr:3-hydroxyacyl-CoA dehydrogenase [Opitutae bacterium]
MAAITDMVDLDIQDGVAVIRIDNPPVNALSEGVRNGLHEAVLKADADDEAEAILIICEGRTYIAGADIREFGNPHRGVPHFEVQDGVSTHQGTGLGGGLEVAICCHYRVAISTARFGFPEVKLGILPGAGGTQRLPRIVGVKKALEMMVKGDMVDANFALENGLIDALVDDLYEGGMAMAKKVVEEGRPLIKVRDANDKLEDAKKDPKLFHRFRRRVARKTRGFDAPESIIQCVEDTLIKSFDDGIQGERDRFQVLVNGIKSEAQRYYFFAERQAGKIPDVPKGTATIPIGKVGMIGGGTMGGGICMNFLSERSPDTIVEANREPLDRGIEVMRKNYLRGVKRGRLTEADVDVIMGRLTPTLSIEDVADCDLVIEAVFENMDLKKEVFTKLDAIVKEGAILATNSSGLDINSIAAVTKRPEMVLGTHFFSPANIMRLLEVIRAEKTSKKVMATVMALAKRLGKVPVVSGVCPGFIGNRILRQRGVQALKLIFEGSMPWDVDRVIFDFGFPMGPFAMVDLAGVDIGWDAENSQGDKNIHHRLCELDRRGQKTGKGWYNYHPETRFRTTEPLVEKLVLEFSEKMGKTRRKISDEEILQRCIYPMINEGAKILEEGISQRPSDIDVVWVNGYAWPVYRGGPMFYADTVGLDKVLAKLKAFQEQDNDDFWQPAPLIEKLVAEGKGFKDMA